jgi:hypothetical protein
LPDSKNAWQDVFPFRHPGPLGKEFMPDIIAQYEKERLT